VPAPDYARGAWVSKRGSRVKHIGVIDRRQQFEPWRPLCNANALGDKMAFNNDPTPVDWYVDLNPKAWHGRTVCKNCIRVVEELNQMLQGTDANSEGKVDALGQGEFEAGTPGEPDQIVMHGFSHEGSGEVLRGLLEEEDM
jgi:hypothetical protein